MYMYNIYRNNRNRKKKDIPRRSGVQSTGSLSSPFIYYTIGLSSL